MRPRAILRWPASDPPDRLSPCLLLVRATHLAERQTARPGDNRDRSVFPRRLRFLSHGGINLPPNPLWLYRAGPELTAIVSIDAALALRSSIKIGPAGKPRQTRHASRSKPILE